MRIQLRRTKGWRMPPNTMKVDRSTIWGNPFQLVHHGTRSECVALFKRLLENDAPLAGYPLREQRTTLKHIYARSRELRGKNLACWCALDGPCHADVLLAFVARSFYPKV